MHLLEKSEKKKSPDQNMTLQYRMNFFNEKIYTIERCFKV